MLCFGTVLHIRPRILDVVAHGSGENADRLADMTSGNSLQHKRVRKSPGERRQEILDAAVRLISERGYNGTSVQDVADAVGVTKQGVLRYFPSKDNLLAAVYHENYNTFGSVEDFMASGLPGSVPDDFRLPAYLRFLVHCNSTRPMLVQLFSILQVESFNPVHPLHDEFANRRDSIWQYYSTYNWNLPSEFTSFEEVRPTLRHALEIMDGVQLRWLRGRPLTYAMNGPIWSRRYFLRRYGTGIADSLCALNRCLCLIAAVSMRANEGVAYIRSFWCM